MRPGKLSCEPKAGLWEKGVCIPHGFGVRVAVIILIKQLGVGPVDQLCWHCSTTYIYMYVHIHTRYPG